MSSIPINKVYYFIHRHFAILFWPVFTAAFIIAFLQIKDQTYLQNDLAPKGIVSLELGPTRTVDSAIVQSWKKDTIDRSASDPCLATSPTINRLQKARTDVHVDFLFILLYTALGVLIIAALQTRMKKEGSLVSNILLALALIAGLCDIVEDLGMLRFINDGVNGTSEAG